MKKSRMTSPKTKAETNWRRKMKPTMTRIAPMSRCKKSRIKKMARFSMQRLKMKMEMKMKTKKKIKNKRNPLIKIKIRIRRRRLKRSWWRRKRRWKLLRKPRLTTSRIGRKEWKNPKFWMIQIFQRKSKNSILFMKITLVLWLFLISHQLSTWKNWKSTSTR